MLIFYTVNIFYFIISPSGEIVKSIKQSIHFRTAEAAHAEARAHRLGQIEKTFPNGCILVPQDVYITARSFERGKEAS